MDNPADIGPLKATSGPRRGGPLTGIDVPTRPSGGFLAGLPIGNNAIGIAVPSHVWEGADALGVEASTSKAFALAGAANVFAYSAACGDGPDLGGGGRCSSSLSWTQ